MIWRKIGIAAILFLLFVVVAWALPTGLPMIGSGVRPPVPVWSPPQLSFGTVDVGASKDLPATLTNGGGGRLVGAISVPSDCVGYQIVSGGGAYSLGRGQSRTVVIRFSPPDSLEYPCILSER
jgi:hypothetical protein